ncbi:hypothetical protein GF371_01170 [Candidatus Woesearchaeota archaeon]|nr:hypothetical protein [Candidatus Woesearchaeota archaeon]
MEKRSIVAKFLALVSVLIVALIAIIPSVSAQIRFEILDQTLGQLHKILQTDTIVFAVLVFLFFFLMYGIFAIGLKQSKISGEKGKLTKNGKVIALSLAGIVILSTFFVRNNVLSFAKNTLAPQFNLFFAIILSVLIFMLFRWFGKQTFDKRPDMANVFGIFSVGLALSMFGAIGEAKWAEGLGLALIIISAVWLLVLIISGTAEEREDKKKKKEGEEREDEEEGKVGTIYGTVKDAVSGDPIRRAKVTATIEGHTYSATSLRDGTYHLYSLPQADNVVIKASADGYADFESDPINIRRDRRFDIAMGTEGRTYPVNLIVRNAVTGDNIDNEADTELYASPPGAPAPVRIPVGEHPGAGIWAVYRGNGQYEVNIVTDRPLDRQLSVTFGAKSPGYLDNTRASTVDDLRSPPAHCIIELMPDTGGARDVHVEVIDASSGDRIVDPGTKLYLGLPGATPRELTAGEYTDDGTGVYTVPEGTINPVFPMGGGTTFTLGASSPGYPSNNSALSIDYSAALQPIYQIPLGGTAGTFSITGRVTDSDNNPVGGARVEFNTHHADTNASGNYTISGIPNTEADPAATIKVSKADYQTATFTKGLNPDMANTHDLQINRYTFKINITDNSTGAIVDTIDDPYNPHPVTLPPGFNYMVELIADPVNGKFDAAAPPAERIFNIPAIAGFTPINFTITPDGNRATLDTAFTVAAEVTAALDIDIKMIDR